MIMIVRRDPSSLRYTEQDDGQARDCPLLAGRTLDINEFFKRFSTVIRFNLFFTSLCIFDSYKFFEVSLFQRASML